MKNDQGSPTAVLARLQLLAATVGLATITLFETMVPPALPAMLKDLQIPDDQIGWALSALLVCGAVTTPLIARLGELYGAARTLAVTLLVVAGGVALAVTASSAAAFILGQAIQGVGFAAMPLALALAQAAPGKPGVSRSVGAMIIGATSVATVVALAAADPLLAAFGWKGIYVLPLIALVPCMAVLAWPSGERTTPATERGSLDWIGALWLAILIGALLLGAQEIRSRPVQAMLMMAAAVACFPLWWRFEGGQPSPLVSVRDLGQRDAVLACIVAVAVGFGTTGAFILVSLTVEPGTAGIRLIPLGLGGAVAAPALTWVLRYLSRPVTMIVGALISTSGIALPGIYLNNDWILALGLCMIGIGLVATLSSALDILVERTSPARVASVSASIFVVRTIGGSFGAQLCSIFAANGAARTTGTPYFIVACVCAIAIPAAAALLRGSTKSALRQA